MTEPYGSDSRGGAGLARYHQGGFETLQARHGLPDAAVLSVLGDADGTPWGIANNVPLQWKAGAFDPGSPEITAKFRALSDTAVAPRGMVWAVDQEALHLFSGGKWSRLSLADGLPSLHINSVIDDQHRTWWVAKIEGELAKVRNEKVLKVYSERDGLPKNPRAAAPHPGFWVTDVCEDRKGNLWLGGTSGWLGRLKNGVFTSYPNPNASASSQSVGRITALFEAQYSRPVPGPAATEPHRVGQIGHPGIRLGRGEG